MTPRENLVYKLDPNELINTLSKPTHATSALLESEESPSLLHIAAREGHLYAALWLLNAGASIEPIAQEYRNTTLAQQDARKSPLYLAVERGHTLLAKSLLILNANKEAAVNLADEFKQDTVKKRLNEKLRIEKSDIRNLVFWSISNYATVYGTKMLDTLLLRFTTEQAKRDPSNIDFIGAMIELAAYHNNTIVVEKLLTAYEPRRTSTQCTAGYWAIVHKNEALYRLVCKDKASILQALQQIHLYRPEIPTAEYIDKISNEGDKEEIKRKLTTEIQDKPEAPKNLSAKLRTNYTNVAANLSIANLRSYCTSLQDSEIKDLYLTAANQRNYVMLTKLCSAITADRHKRLFIAMLDQHQPSHAKLMVFSANIDVYQAAIDQCQEGKKFLDGMLTLDGEQPGILYRLIKRSTSPRDLATEKEMRIRKELFHSPDKAAPLIHTILRCLHDFAPPLYKKDIENLLAEKIPSTDVLFTKISSLPLHLRTLITNRLSRFGQATAAIDISTDPFGIAAHRVTELADELQQKEREFSQLDTRIQSIDHYLERQEHYISTRCCYHHQVRHDGVNLFLLLTFISLSAIISADTAIFYVPMEQKTDAALDLLESTRADNSTKYCIEYFSQLRGCKTKTIIPELCQTLCEELNDVRYSTEYAAAVAVMAMLAAIVVVILPFMFAIHNKETFYNGRKRFEQFTISEFSQEVISAAEDMLRLNADQFPETSLATLYLPNMQAQAAAARRIVESTREPLRNQIESLRLKLGMLPYDQDQVQINSAHEPEYKKNIATAPVSRAGVTLFQSNSVSLASKRYGATEDNNNLNLSQSLLRDEEQSDDIRLEINPMHSSDEDKHEYKR